MMKRIKVFLSLGVSLAYLILALIVIAKVPEGRNYVLISAGAASLATIFVGVLDW